MHTPAIICLGHAALDRIYRITAFPPSPQKLRASAVEEVGGGMAANAAVAASRLGARVAFLGRIGGDLAGSAIRAGLAAEGVDATGERLLVNHRGEGLTPDPSWLDLSAVPQARAVLADVRWPEGALALFTAARAAGVPTVLDADIGAGPALPALLALADYALFSTPGLAEFAEGNAEAGLARARAAGPRHAGVTQGANGYLWLDDSGLHHAPAWPIIPIDTSGAGDAFHGGFTWALASGHPISHCIAMGQAVAAIKCLQPGNRAGLPDAAALHAFMAAQSK